jgi:hypothetical protein
MAQWKIRREFAVPEPQQAFERTGAMGAARKAVAFTESRRTQDYLARYLVAHG